MGRTDHRRGRPSPAVYLLFLLGLLCVVVGVLYPAEALLDAASPESVVTGDDVVDGGAVVLGGAALLLGSWSLVVAELLVLARR